MTLCKYCHKKLRPFKYREGPIYYHDRCLNWIHDNINCWTACKDPMKLRHWKKYLAVYKPSNAVQITETENILKK